MIFLLTHVLGDQAAEESGGRKSVGDGGGDVDSPIEVTPELRGRNDYNILNMVTV
jgi:hypothetical protein